jgi:cytidine deaminase
MTDTELILTATDAAHRAYCPYSRFPVGAALLTRDGRVFTGVNVENASFGLTICAERNAIAAAVAAGAHAFETIAIAADGNGGQAVTPCGACRQVLAEFGPPGLRILTASIHPPVQTGVYTLTELLPEAFEQTSIPSTNKEPTRDD